MQAVIEKEDLLEILKLLMPDWPNRFLEFAKLVIWDNKVESIYKLIDKLPELLEEKPKYVDFVLKQLFTRLSRNLRAAKKLLGKDRRITNLLIETISNSYKVYEHIFQIKALNTSIKNMLLHCQKHLLVETVQHDYLFYTSSLLLADAKDVSITSMPFRLKHNQSITGSLEHCAVKTRAEIDDLFNYRYSEL